MIGKTWEECGTDLLDSGNVTSDVLDRDGVFDGETMGLTLGTCLVNEDSTIGSETCRKMSLACGNDWSQRRDKAYQQRQL